MPAWIALGAGALSGLMGSSASKRAAEAQARSQLEAARIQAEYGDRALAQLAAGTQAGLDVTRGQRGAADIGLAALMSGLGLGQYRVGPRSSGGGYIRPDGTPYTGDVRTDGMGRPVDDQGRQLRQLASYEIGGPSQEEVDAAASPYAGTFLEKFTGQDIYRDPSYEFRLNEGRRNLEASLAARGNRLGSQSLKDITNYGQQAGSQEFQSAFDRFQLQKQREFERLMGLVAPGAQAQQSASGMLSGSGRDAAGITTGQGQAMGQGIANAGQATAGGIMGSTNALVGGINTGVNAYTTQQYMNQQRDMFNQYMNSGNTGSYFSNPSVGGMNIGLLGGTMPRLGG